MLVQMSGTCALALVFGVYLYSVMARQEKATGGEKVKSA